MYAVTEDHPAFVKVKYLKIAGEELVWEALRVLDWTDKGPVVALPKGQFIPTPGMWRR